jgi:hypothetical protein
MYVCRLVLIEMFTIRRKLVIKRREILTKYPHMSDLNLSDMTAYSIPPPLPFPLANNKTGLQEQSPISALFYRPIYRSDLVQHTTPKLPFLHFS